MTKCESLNADHILCSLFVDLCRQARLVAASGSRDKATDVHPESTVFGAVDGTQRWLLSASSCTCTVGKGTCQQGTYHYFTLEFNIQEEWSVSGLES